MTLLSSLIGKEIYLVAHENETELTEMYASELFLEAVEFLSSKDTVVNDDLMVFHGVLCPARVLPKSSKNKSVCLIVQDSKDDTLGICIEVNKPNVDKIASAIEEFISSDGDEIKAVFPEGISIDNMFILYGHRMELEYTINDADIDEETIATCKEIYGDVQKVLESVESY